MSSISLYNFVRGNLVGNVFRKPYLYKMQQKMKDSASAV